MQSYFFTFSFILGILIGSFLNVVALRYNTGMTLKGRSKCFSCGKNLKWYELVPLFSFAFQKGKCRNCKSKISWQYPVVELLAGVLFVLVIWAFPPLTVQASFTTLYYIFITCLLLVIIVYDVKHKIIPDQLVYLFGVVSLLKLFISTDLSFVVPSINSILAGPILALPFALLFLFSKGTWMGLGDAKLVLGIGWTLGLINGISAVILSFWIGAILSVIWMYIVFRKVKSHYEIPFGPFLVLGMYLVLIFSIQVIDLRPFLILFSN
jgi:prepilin signal peptidase PulO-like enzyme (type II secretory pathway)